MDVEKNSNVCCLCGDVGFPDKLFRCHKCRFRFQHTYCSNYYTGSESIVSCCDWCESEDQSSVIRKPSCSKRSEQKMTKKQQEGGDGNNVNNSNNQSPRTSGTRRYKLLKDVMC